jgi:very-short-patch-repair endonuclease
MFACAQWGAVGEFAASRHGAFTRKQAAELGLSSKVVARLKDSGHLDEPLPGVLVVVGSVPTWKQRLVVATLGSSSGVAGFRSAAALHQFDGYAPGPIEVVVANWRQPLAALATQHRAKVIIDEVVSVDRVPCTGIARTLADLGSVDPVQKVRIAFESVWRRGVSLQWLRDNAERLHRPGQSGTRVLLQLLDEAEHAMRPTESALELRLERCLKGIEGVVRQFNVRDARGRFVARADFAIPDVKIAIEAHSREFHFGPSAAHRDEMREQLLVEQGWLVLYFGDRQLRAPAKVRTKVRTVVERRRADFGAKLLVWRPSRE